MDKKTSEIIVKVLSVLGYIAAAAMLIVGLIVIFVGSAALNYASQAGLIPGVIPVGILASLAVVIGSLIIAFGVLEFFVAKGLWEFKNWARIVSLVFAVLGFISGIFTFPMSIVGLVINGFIIYLFGFDATTKSLFK